MEAVKQYKETDMQAENPQLEQKVWNHRHILDLDDFTPAEIDLVMQTTDAMHEILSRPIKKVPTLRGKTVVTLFYEASTRTRSSFELAAKNGYLNKVDVTLLNAFGSEVKATTYSFTDGDDATGTARPGGVRWPETPSGQIRVVLHPKAAWDKEPEKASKLPWKLNWGPSNVDTSHSGLTPSGNRGYSSNGFGANRNDFS